MRELIIQNNSNVAIIDDEDYEKLSKYKWYYVKGTIRRKRTKEDNPNLPDKIRLSREILNFPNGVVDHINRDIFFNLKSNLRVCSQSDNSKNQSKPIGRFSSVYKGVSYNKLLYKWTSQIKVNRKKIHLGVFNDEKEAALAYNKAAIKYFGEFASLNNIINDN